MIDKIDRELLDVLGRAPQTSNRAIAQALGLSETTIGVRLERLSSTNVARVIAQRDVRALGWHVSAYLDVYLKGGDPEEMVARLHAKPNVVSIFQMAGTPELFVKIAAADLVELSRIALQELGGDPAVRRVDVNVSLGGGHMRAGFGNLESPRLKSLRDGEGDLQDQITEILARDGRISNREISRTLGVAEATVRARIRGLQHKGLLRYVLICNPERVGYNALVFARFRAPPGAVRELSAAICQHPNVFGATVTTGPHNLLVSIYAPSWPQAWEICGQITDGPAEDVQLRPATSFAHHRYDLAFISPD
ncbi:MAG: AsnC family transcriptional regulator [Caulobacteraceae bacterium]|nr:AsnC family transcriptional regulator [Caulobacteraceae bacterium]